MRKEAYFTPDNIQEVSLSMLKKLDSHGLSRKKITGFGRLALLVLDMQDYFLDPSSHAFIPSAPAIVPNIQKLVKAVRELGFPVIFTRHVNSPEEAGQMGIWWNDIITSENKLSAIIKDFGSPDLVVNKSQYDAFHETELYYLLEDYGTDSVIITGVMANLCCETTSRQAFVQGFRPVFPVDATAACTQELHEASLLNLAHGFTEPLTTDDLIKRINHF